MDVVDMVLMRHRDVPTPVAVDVLVSGVFCVSGRLALVGVTSVVPVQVPVMDIVNVIFMRHRDVPTRLAVDVLVVDVLSVRGSAHDVFSSTAVRGSVVWRTASRAI
jgi:hypothetical protein